MKNIRIILALVLFINSKIIAQSSKIGIKNTVNSHLSKSGKGQEIDLTKIIWSDEFNTNGKPDPTNWSYDLGGHGWGNAEKQNYTNSEKNAFVRNGILNIVAIKETSGENAYTSARLVTKNKADFTYGRFEIKAKLPLGVGTWPAIWMLPTESSYSENYWPDNGEIDIMEHVGYDQNVVHGSIHTKSYNHIIGTQKTSKTVIENASSEFHVYAMNWLPNKIAFEIDGKVLYEVNKAETDTWKEWPFDKKFHLLLNIAVGGGWGGQKGIDDSIFPQSMLIDYVRIYGIRDTSK